MPKNVTGITNVYIIFPGQLMRYEKTLVKYVDGIKAIAMFTE